MPYIKQNERKDWDTWLSHEIRPRNITSPGMLNYIITKLCLHYLSHKDESYTIYNEIIGTLECCKQELYRRKIVDYENFKCEQNGDVYQ